MLVARSRMEDGDNQLTQRARQLIAGIQSRYTGKPLEPREEQPPSGALAFKTA